MTEAVFDVLRGFALLLGQFTDGLGGLRQVAGDLLLVPGVVDRNGPVAL